MNRYIISGTYTITKEIVIESKLSKKTIKKLIDENPYRSLEELKAKVVSEKFDLESACPNDEDFNITTEDEYIDSFILND